jgi:hypothetical protein
VISVEDWAEIRRLHKAEGLPIKQVARARATHYEGVPVHCSRVQSPR